MTLESQSLVSIYGLLTLARAGSAKPGFIVGAESPAF